MRVVCSVKKSLKVFLEVSMTERFTVRDDKDYVEVVDRIVSLLREYNFNTVEVVGLLRIVEIQLFSEDDDYE